MSTQVTPVSKKQTNVALYADWSHIAQFDDTATIVCLTDKQRQMLLTITEYLRWRTRWENLSIDKDALDALVSDLEARLMCDCTDDITNTLLKKISDSDYRLERAIATQFNALRQLAYDDTPKSINPDTPITTFLPDATIQRERALCNAVTFYVKKMVQDALSAYRSHNGLEIVLYPALATIASGLNAILGGRARVNVTNTLAQLEEAVTDPDAIRTVTYEIVNTLKTTAVNYTAWDNAIGSLAVGAGARARVVEILNKGASELENYLFFLDLLGSSWRIAFDNIYECPTVTPFTSTYDFRTSTHGFIQVPDSGTDTRAIWVSGQGWRRGSGVGQTGAQGNRYIQITGLGNIGYITSIDLVFSGTSVSPNFAQAHIPKFTSENNPPERSISIPLPLTGTKTIAVYYRSSDGLWISIDNSQTGALPTDFTLQQLIIKGYV